MDLLNVTDGAKFVGVTRKTIYEWEKKGKIKRVMMGSVRMFSKKELSKAKESSKK